MEKVQKKPTLRPYELNLTSQPMSVFRWRANPPAGTDFDLLLEPAYWENVRDKFRVNEPKHQGQVIEIYPEDGEYYAELLAERLNNGQLSITKLLFVTKEGNKTTLRRDDFVVEFKGPKKHCIVRVADGVIVEDCISTKMEANERLEEYLKTG